MNANVCCRPAGLAAEWRRLFLARLRGPLRLQLGGAWCCRSAAPSTAGQGLPCSAEQHQKLWDAPAARCLPENALVTEGWGGKHHWPMYGCSTEEGPCLDHGAHCLIVERPHLCQDGIHPLQEDEEASALGGEKSRKQTQRTQQPVCSL